MIFIKKKLINVYPGELKDIFRLLFSGQFLRGRFVSQFEEVFGRYVGRKYAVAVSSGRFALHCLLSAFGITEGDEVILSAYNFKAVPRTIVNLGAKPVFVDVNLWSLNINPEEIENKITSRTKAIIVTHMFGYPAEIDRIQTLGQKYGIKVIEDCAHSCGTEYQGGKLGSFGDAAFFSFGIAKTLNTFGGGMITTDDGAVYEFAKSMVEGCEGTSSLAVIKECFMAYIYLFLLNSFIYLCFTFPVLFFLNAVHFDYLGVLRSRKSEPADKRGRLSNLQAYVGIKLLQGLDQLNAKKLNRITYLKKCLRADLCRTQNECKKMQPAFLYLALLIPEASKAKKALFLKGVDADNAYMQNCARMFNDKGHFPMAEKICNEILSIQVDGNMKDEELNELAEVLNNVITSTDKIHCNIS